MKNKRKPPRIGLPEEMEISTAMTVLMHSYSSDIADVEWIRFVSGSISFLPSLQHEHTAV